MIPSGIIRKNKISIIGNGVVVNPSALLEEIRKLNAAGIKITKKNLRISENSSIIFSFHKKIDEIREERKGPNKIGTTGRGIGPAYEDKVGRRAIRFADLVNKRVLKEKIKTVLDYHNVMLAGLNSKLLTEKEIYDEINLYKKQILKYVDRTSKILREAKSLGKKILFEGAQGVLLDIDHGTYPFVTSSNTLPSAASSGTGMPVKEIGYILGIVKAYTTRVGSGPFPSELSNSIGQKLGQIGNEFGTVTGRQRRCGWFDSVITRHSMEVAGIDGIALTKLDVLDSFKEIKICIGYKLDNSKIDYFPLSESDQRRIKPIYETHQGWMESTQGAKSWTDLPALAIKYVRRVEELLQTQVSLLSTSPRREDTILVRNPFID